MAKNEVGHGMMDWDACLKCKHFPGEDEGGCHIRPFPELSINQWNEILCEDYEEAK